MKIILEFRYVENDTWYTIGKEFESEALPPKDSGIQIENVAGYVTYIEWHPNENVFVISLKGVSGDNVDLEDLVTLVEEEGWRHVDDTDFYDRDIAWNKIRDPYLDKVGDPEDDDDDDDEDDEEETEDSKEKT